MIKQSSAGTANEVDDERKSNPDVELGTISYLGLTISWPDGEIIGNNLHRSPTTSVQVVELGRVPINPLP